MTRGRGQKGLTLIETLVALAILGAVAAAVLTLVGQNTRFVAAAEDKMLAGILLDNLMTEDLARFSPLAKGEEEREAAFAGRRWLVRRTVSGAGAHNLARIEIAVSQTGRAQVLARAVALKADGP